MHTIEELQRIIWSYANTWTEFYKEKIDKIIEAQRQDSNIEEMHIEKKFLEGTIKKHFPEAIIKGSADKKLLIKLNNVDFHIEECHKHDTLFIDRYYFISYPIEQIPNIIELMKEIDDMFPEWDKIFAGLTIRLEQELNAIHSLQSNCSLSLLLHKIRIVFLNCRRDFDTGSTLCKKLNEANISFSNITVDANNQTIVIQITYKGSVSQFRLAYTEISIEQLQHIDNMIPIWTEEIKIERERYENIRDFSKHNYIIPIKEKMDSLGYEYCIAENKRTLTLYVKLEKSRKIKLSFSRCNSTGTILQRLEKIDETIKSINNIHEAFIITNNKKNKIWQTNFRKTHELTNINNKSVVELIKWRMETIGCEYFIEKNKGESSLFTLYVKLKNGRIAKITLPSISIGVARERLGMIDETIKTINSIPKDITIINNSKDLFWETMIVNRFNEWQTLYSVYEECWKTFSAKFPYVKRPEIIISHKLKKYDGLCYGDKIKITDRAVKESLKFQKHLIFHELSHLVHANHSSNFYDVLGMFVPLPTPINLDIEQKWRSHL